MAQVEKEPEEDRQAQPNYPKLDGPEWTMNEIRLQSYHEQGQLLLTFRCLSGVSSPLRPARAFASGIWPQLAWTTCWTSILEWPFTQQRFFGLLPGVRHASVQASGTAPFTFYRPNKFRSPCGSARSRFVEHMSA